MNSFGFAALILVPFLAACSVARMDVQGGGPSSLNLSSGSGANTITEKFTASPQLEKVDILFVDDNSASMDPLQTTLGAKFADFATAISGLDWQIGITTTDCSTGPYGICGSLLQFSGLGSYILSPNSPNLSTAFANTIVRPETVGCVARGNCPSGISEPLKATMTSFDKRNSNNSGFFRNGAALAVIMLTDADEADSGPPTATQPQAVIDHFKSIWGVGKTLTAYAIDIMPGDNACLQQDQAASQGLSYYGVAPSGLATATGGVSESICSNDYTPLLQQIGGDLRNSPTVVTLAHVPASNSVNVSITPSTGTTESLTLTGNVMTISPPLPAGTEITVQYSF